MVPTRSYSLMALILTIAAVAVLTDGTASVDIIKLADKVCNQECMEQIAKKFQSDLHVRLRRSLTLAVRAWDATWHYL